jgi:hypothetical protein
MTWFIGYGNVRRFAGRLLHARVYKRVNQTALQTYWKRLQIALRNWKVNERIRELAEQSGGFPCSEDEWGFYNKDLEKFAELIVRECANIALREDHDPYECILKHFGVEKMSGYCEDCGNTICICDEIQSAKPVAWMDKDVLERFKTDRDDVTTRVSVYKCINDIPLYTTPQQREWIGLTEDEAAECWNTSAVQTWKNIEAKLKEKNP